MLVVKVAEVNDLEDGELLAVEVDGEPICLAKSMILFMPLPIIVRISAALSMKAN